MVVIEQLLSNVLESDVVGAVFLELPIRELNVPLSSSRVVVRVHCFN